jgi:hypothetical protein
MLNSFVTSNQASQTSVGLTVTGTDGLSNTQVAAYANTDFRQLQVTIDPAGRFRPDNLIMTGFIADASSPLSVQLDDNFLELKSIMVNDSGIVPVFINEGSVSVKLNLIIIA